MGFFRNVALVVEIIALVGIIGLSLTTVVVMALLKGNFDGFCPLYPKGEEFLMTFYHHSNCNFVIGMHVVAFLIAIAAGAYRLYELCKQKELSSFIPFITVIIYLVVAVLVMATACIVTVGFNKLCSEFSKMFPYYTECIRYQHENTFKPPYDASHFHDYLLIAEMTTWICFGVWLFIAGLTILSRIFFKNDTISHNIMM